jgi:hypothetical protein
MHEYEIGTLIVDSAVHLHQDLGPGLLETVYEVTLAAKLRKRGLSVGRQPAKVTHLAKAGGQDVPRAAANEPLAADRAHHLRVRVPRLVPVSDRVLADLDDAVIAYRGSRRRMGRWAS